MPIYVWIQTRIKDTNLFRFTALHLQLYSGYSFWEEKCFSEVFMANKWNGLCSVIRHADTE
jgi:hypothetical protein